MRVTPTHLQKALSCVKRYVEKMPDGASLTQLANKVNEYHALGRKDREMLIDVIRDSGQILVVDDGRMKTLHHPKFDKTAAERVAKRLKESMENNVQKLPVTPEDLRDQAAALMKAAEEVERKNTDRAELKKKIDPLKLEILQAYGQASRKLDEFVDAMAVMEKAVQKLKDINL